MDFWFQNLQKTIELKKKLLITTHTLNIGGVERSFISLLENLDYSKYKVDVFIYEHDGELFHLLPKEVRVLTENLNYSLLLKPILEAIKKGYWNVVLIKILAKFKTILKSKLLKKSTDKSDSLAHVYLYELARWFLPEISSTKYDAVLAFLHPNFFESTKVKADKYIAWVHTDYSFLNIDRNVELSMWSKFDYIVGVSEASVKTFTIIFPELKNKLRVIENVLTENFVKNQAGLFNVSAEMKIQEDEIQFLSVGRFSYPKNFENIPMIAKYLKEQGLQFKWYIIGYGSEELKIKNAITEEEMEGIVQILGKKENPYPYIKACDFYIQPSRFEGKAVTVREAQMLGKAVIITNFSSAESQLVNGFDGVIVPMDNKVCADKIYEFVTNKNLVTSVITNIKNEDYSNIGEITKIYQLIE